MLHSAEGVCVGGTFRGSQAEWSRVPQQDQFGARGGLALASGSDVGATEQVSVFLGPYGSSHTLGIA